jgi:hydroxysqualene dehydroxylase
MAGSHPVDPMPAAPVAIETRATSDARPAQAMRRPATGACSKNLVLAGDCTATGLPATTEGAIRPA